MAAYRLLPHGTLEGVIGSTQVLYLLIFLVGTDLVHVRLGGLNRRVFLLPLFAAAATAAAGLAFSLLTPYSFGQSLMLSAGFGWFSLSGPMVGELVSAEMGATALMTDFFAKCSASFFFIFSVKPSLPPPSAFPARRRWIPRYRL